MTLVGVNYELDIMRLHLKMGTRVGEDEMNSMTREEIMK